MRILNRPMFKYGGPIKEGVMHGMRNNYQSGQLVRPGPGRPGYQGETFWQKLAAQYKPRNLFKWSRINPFSTKKLKAAQQVPKIAKNLQGIFVKKATSPGITSTGAGRTFLQNLKDFSFTAPSWLKTAGTGVKNIYTRAPKKSIIGTTIAAPYAIDIAKKIPWKGVGDIIKAPYEKWKDVLGIGDGEKDETDKIDTGTKIKPIGPGAQFKEDTAPILTDSMRAELAKKQQNKRLKSYLDMMGYDSAKRGALDKALIDASAVVQQGTEEAGSLKEADWGKMINKMIQTTSRRLEKPEQIREAVGLMMTKGAIEKDIAEGKGGALKQNARDLVSAGVYKTEREAMKHLAKKTSFEDVLIALAGKHGDIKGSHLEDAWRMSESGIPKARVKATDEIYENFVDKNEKLADIELEFVDKQIQDKQPGDVFVIDNRLIIIQEDGTPKYRW